MRAPAPVRGQLFLFVFSFAAHAAVHGAPEDVALHAVVHVAGAQMGLTHLDPWGTQQTKTPMFHPHVSDFATDVGASSSGK